MHAHSAECGLRARLHAAWASKLGGQTLQARGPAQCRGGTGNAAMAERLVRSCSAIGAPVRAAHRRLALECGRHLEPARGERCKVLVGDAVYTGERPRARLHEDGVG